MGKGCLAAAAAATVAANAGRRVVRQAGGVGAIGRPRCSGVPVYRATAAANAANAAAATATTTPSRWWPLQARLDFYLVTYAAQSKSSASPHKRNEK